MRFFIDFYRMIVLEKIALDIDYTMRIGILFGTFMYYYFHLKISRIK